MDTGWDLGSLQQWQNIYWSSSPAGPDYMVVGVDKPKKKLPDLHSMKLNHLPDNLRKLADEVLKEKYA